MLDLSGLKIGFAITGSFCTFDKAFEKARKLKQAGAEIIPIMSETAFKTDTRFGKAKERSEELQLICGRNIIKTIAEAEPIGPTKMIDIILVCPCTGNTIAKLANSITDTAVVVVWKQKALI